MRSLLAIGSSLTFRAAIESQIRRHIATYCENYGEALRLLLRAKRARAPTILAAGFNGPLGPALGNAGKDASPIEWGVAVLDWTVDDLPMPQLLRRMAAKLPTYILARRMTQGLADLAINNGACGASSFADFYKLRPWIYERLASVVLADEVGPHPGPNKRRFRLVA